MKPIGQLDVLNVGRGHLQIKFDKADDADSDKARRVIQDMLKRGYLLFVEINGEHHRATAFDPERDEYILKEAAEITGEEKIAEPPLPEIKDEQAGKEKRTGEKAPVKKSPPPLQEVRGRRAKMQHHRATAIAPTAGG